MEGSKDALLLRHRWPPGHALWCATCPKPAKDPDPGTLVQAQLWYRDPQNSSNQTTSLSDALEFLVYP